MLLQTSLLCLLSVSTSSPRPRWTCPKPDESRRNFRPSLQPTATLFARPKTGTPLSARRSRTVRRSTACASEPPRDTSHSTGSQKHYNRHASVHSRRFEELARKRARKARVCQYYRHQSIETQCNHMIFERKPRVM